MKISGHTYVMALVVGVILWLAARGRLVGVVKAIETQPSDAPKYVPPGGTGNPIDSGGSSGGPLGPPNWGAPSSGPTDPWGAPLHPFGLKDVTNTHYETAWLGADRGLISDAVAEINYMLPPGTREPITLPTGTWVEQQRTNQPGVEGIEVWKNTQDQATLGFLHLSDLGAYQPGMTYHGGSIGMTGWPTSSQYAVSPPGPGPADAHLAVIANRAGLGYL